MKFYPDVYLPDPQQQDKYDKDLSARLAEIFRDVSQTFESRFPLVVNLVNATGNTAALSATSVYTPATDQVLTVDVIATITTRATTGAATSTLGPITCGWTNANDSAAKTRVTGSITSNLIVDALSFSFPVYVKANSNVTVAIAYASDTASQMTYDYTVTVTRKS